MSRKAERGGWAGRRNGITSDDSGSRKRDIKVMWGKGVKGRSWWQPGRKVGEGGIPVI